MKIENKIKKVMKGKVKKLKKDPTISGFANIWKV